MKEITRNQKPPKNPKFGSLVYAGLLGTIAFNVAMYVDIAITGIPLDIVAVLRNIAVGESEYSQVIGQAIHLANGVGLSLFFGYVLLDQSSAASKPMEPDPGRIKFYKQLNLRRDTREHFDDAYGKTDYIHITREKMQQMILYLPLITIYLTLEKSITPEEVKVAAQKIKFIDNELISNPIKS